MNAKKAAKTKTPKAPKREYCFSTEEGPASEVYPGQLTLPKLLRRMIAAMDICGRGEGEFTWTHELPNELHRLLGKLDADMEKIQALAQQLRISGPR